MKDENLLKTFTAWESLSQTPETIVAYNSRLKAILDEEARLDDVREKSLEEGFEKGIEQGIEKVARKMLAKGKSNEEIIDATDLTVEEVEALRAEIQTP